MYDQNKLSIWLYSLCFLPFPTKVPVSDPYGLFIPLIIPFLIFHCFFLFIISNFPLIIFSAKTACSLQLSLCAFTFFISIFHWPNSLFTTHCLLQFQIRFLGGRGGGFAWLDALRATVLYHRSLRMRHLRPTACLHESVCVICYFCKYSINCFIANKLVEPKWA